MKDIIGARHPLKQKKDKKGKRRVSSTKAPSSTPVSRPTGISFPDPIVDTTAGDSKANRPKDKGKGWAEDPLSPPSKRARVESDEVPMIPPSPHLSKFDLILVLNKALPFEATSQRDELTRASTENEKDPTVEALRFLLSTALQVQVAHV